MSQLWSVSSGASKLREKMQEEAPELLGELERSYALVQAYGRVGDGGHYGGRLFHAVSHLDRLLDAHDQQRDVGTLVNSTEIYLILMSLLARRRTPARKAALRTPAPRADASPEATRLEQAAVPNPALAKIVAKLRRTVDAANEELGALETELAGLSIRRIAPFGDVREHTSAAVAVLLECMAATYQSAPDGDEMQEGLVERSRRATWDIQTDLPGRTMKTVLNDEFDGFGSLASPKAGTDHDATFQSRAKLAELGQATRRNQEILHVLHPILSASGLFLRSWLVEHRDRLFIYDPTSLTTAWTETHEPGLSSSYLLRIARTMWNLSTQIFGEGFFTYDALADAMREPQPDRARCAAKRLAVLAAGEVKPWPRLWMGATHWRWLAQSGDAESQQAARDNLLRRIGELASPISSTAEAR